MKIGIIGPSKLNNEHRELISKLARIVSKKGHEIVIIPDKSAFIEPPIKLNNNLFNGTL